MINFIDKKTLAKEYLLLAKNTITKNPLASIFYAKRSLSINPNDTFGLILVSRALYDQKNYAEALKYLQESIAIIKTSTSEDDREVLAQLLCYELRCKLKLYNFDAAQAEIKKTFSIFDKLKVRTKDILEMIEELEVFTKEYLQTRGQVTVFPLLSLKLFH